MSDDLQTLKRGLKALAFLNEEGPLKVASLARKLEVPRASAHRIVNTLTREGYCRKVPNSHLYVSVPQSGERARAPSPEGLLTSLSIDIVEELGRVVQWPVALATPQARTMLVRLATHLSTPLALTKIAPGHVTPMLDACTGLTFLAHSEAEISDAVLQDPASWEGARELQGARATIDTLLSWIRRDGFFILRREGSEASLGVPILLDGRPVGGIAMRYIKTATTRAHVVSVYVPRLQAAAAEIEAQLASASAPRTATTRVFRSPGAEPELSWMAAAAM